MSRFLYARISVLLNSQNNKILVPNYHLNISRHQFLYCVYEQLYKYRKMGKEGLDTPSLLQLSNEIDEKYCSKLIKDPRSLCRIYEMILNPGTEKSPLGWSVRNLALMLMHLTVTKLLRLCSVNGWRILLTCLTGQIHLFSICCVFCICQR